MPDSPKVEADKQVVARVREKEDARQYQRRRHRDWDDNYQLYRNDVKVNRLTQRQEVNIPLMKETIKTLMSKIDDAPQLDWQELNGDEHKELLFQEMWNSDFDRINFEGIDIQDKKNVLLYGRSFKKLGWGKDGMEVDVLDIYDVVIDPLTNPLDLETARFVIHQNIFRPIEDVMEDDRYTPEGKAKLKEFLLSEDAVVQSGQNRINYERKTRRLREFTSNNQESGFDYFNDIAAGGVIVNITEHISNVWNKGKKEFEKRVIVYADDAIELMDKPLKELLGIDFYPYVTWGDDVETNDFWSDASADLVRSPNKIVNMYYSQMIENRMLSNFQMHWYDATIEGYVPQTYEPGQGRMLPAPGDPNKVIKPVDISGLDETMTAIDFIIRTVEKATAATSIEKGIGEDKQVTLGEVEILVGKALERVTAITKFYRRSWYDLAIKWYQLMVANEKGSRKLYKLAASGKIWAKTVTRKDWTSEFGYKPIVRSSSEQEAEKTKAVQMIDFVMQRFPNNVALRKIGRSRMLELIKLTPEEMRSVEEADKQQEEQIEQQPIVQEQTDLQQGIQNSLGQLNV